MKGLDTVESLSAGARRFKKLNLGKKLLVLCGFKKVSNLDAGAPKAC